MLDSAASGVAAAQTIRSELLDRDLHVRIGLNVGDVERRGDDVSGLAVNLAARAMDQAQPGEILITESAAISVVGAGLNPTLQGRYDLKGLPGDWALYQL